MLQGNQTWVFQNQPVILTTGVTGGPFEANGRLADDFDFLCHDLWMGKESYEKANRFLLEEAISISLNKAGMSKNNVQFMIAGDLVNQITPTSFAARTVQIPYLGIYGACSTSMEGLALAAFIVNYYGAKYIITGASSHNAAAERQFRYPTEYGGQKPPTAQWTVTGAGVAIVAQRENNTEIVPYITSATIGKVIDMGISDPFNMGGAMAPAAADTIIAHLNDRKITIDYYDLILTGDLGKVGRNTVLDLLIEKKINVQQEQLQDCGLLIYQENQPVQAGGSGAGCSATVLYGHIINEMKKGTYKRILVVATGALLSTLSIQQKDTIPSIAHAVSIEI